jgi:hypothetical protein
MCALHWWYGVTCEADETVGPLEDHAIYTGYREAKERAMVTMDDDASERRGQSKCMV